MRINRTARNRRSRRGELGCHDKRLIEHVTIEQSRPAAPALLERIKRNICMLEEFVRTFGVPRKHGATYAAIETDGPSADLERAPELPENSIAYFEQIRSRSASLDHHCELIAAEPRNEIARRNALGKTITNFLKQLVRAD